MNKITNPHWALSEGSCSEDWETFESYIRYITWYYFEETRYEDEGLWGLTLIDEEYLDGDEEWEKNLFIFEEDYEQTGRPKPKKGEEIYYGWTCLTSQFIDDDRNDELWVGPSKYKGPAIECWADGTEMEQIERSSEDWYWVKLKTETE